MTITLPTDLKPHGRRIRYERCETLSEEHRKNISLLVLCGLMGVLCAVNWLMGLNIAQCPQTAHSAVCTTAL